MESCNNEDPQPRFIPSQILSVWLLTRWQNTLVRLEEEATQKELEYARMQIDRLKTELSIFDN